MVTPIGGIGDVIAISSLIYKITLEIKSNPDSAPEFQDLSIELNSLDHALKEAFCIRPGVHELKRLDSIRAVATSCQIPLQDFLAKIQKFNSPLGPWNNGRHSFHRAARGLQWSFAWKEEVKTLRAKLSPKLLTILFLIAVQTIDSGAKAEIDRAEIAQKAAAKSSIQQAILEDLKTGQASNHTFLRNMLSAQMQLIADSKDQTANLTSLDLKAADIAEHVAAGEQHLNKQDIYLGEIRDAITLSNVGTQLTVDGITAVQHDVATIKTNTTSLVDLSSRLTHLFTTGFAQLRMVADMISDLVKLTTDSSTAILHMLKNVLEVLWTLRTELAQISSVLSRAIDLRYPMVTFRDAFNTPRDFPFDLFRHWEKSQRLIAAIFVGHRDLPRVEMGHYFVTHVRRGTKIDPKVWAHAIEPQDQLTMTMVFDDLEAEDGFCPFQSCRADTSGVAMERGGKFCPRCQRFAVISEKERRATIMPTDSKTLDDGHQLLERFSSAHDETDFATTRKTREVTSTQELILDPPSMTAPEPETSEFQNIEEYHFVQVVRMQSVVDEHQVKETSPASGVLDDLQSIEVSEPDAMIEIKVETLDGRMAMIPLQRSDTVSTLKSRVQFALDVPQDEQRLICTGRQLEDSKSLSEYKIEPTSRIFVVRRLKNKGPMYSTSRYESRYEVDPHEYRHNGVESRTTTPTSSPSYGQYGYYYQEYSSQGSPSPRKHTRRAATRTPFRRFVYPDYSTVYYDEPRYQLSNEGHRSPDNVTVDLSRPAMSDSSPMRSEVPQRRRSQAISSVKLTATATKAKAKKTAMPRPLATEEDAKKAGIPAGFSLKNWDPTERPLILLGSVFDANSLGSGFTIGRCTETAHPRRWRTWRASCGCC